MEKDFLLRPFFTRAPYDPELALSARKIPARSPLIGHHQRKTAAFAFLGHFLKIGGQALLREKEGG